MKVCTKCKESKKFSCFSKSKDTKDKLQYTCKQCMAQYRRDNNDVLYEKKLTYISKNREAHLQKKRSHSKIYYKANKESTREKNRASGKIYRKTHKEKFAAYSGERRSYKLNATPPWLTDDHLKEIETFYWLASDLQLVSGEVYHVDHIVPLKGKTVCGLHVPWNLQVLPSDMNISKSNDYDGGWF